MLLPIRSITVRTARWTKKHMNMHTVYPGALTQVITCIQKCKETHDKASTHPVASTAGPIACDTNWGQEHAGVKPCVTTMCHKSLDFWPHLTLLRSRRGDWKNADIYCRRTKIPAVEALPEHTAPSCSAAGMKQLVSEGLAKGHVSPTRWHMVHDFRCTSSTQMRAIGMVILEGSSQLKIFSQGYADIGVPG